jgi:hypothetical protein
MFLPSVVAVPSCDENAILPFFLARKARMC